MSYWDDVRSFAWYSWVRAVPREFWLALPRRRMAGDWLTFEVATRYCGAPPVLPYPVHREADSQEIVRGTRGDECVVCGGPRHTVTTDCRPAKRRRQKYRSSETRENTWETRNL